MGKTDCRIWFNEERPFRKVYICLCINFLVAQCNQPGPSKESRGSLDFSDSGVTMVRPNINKQNKTPPKSAKKRKVSSPLLQAALNRIARSPRQKPVSDEYSCKGEAWGHRLRSQMAEDPIQGVIAQKLIEEVFYLASLKKLSHNSSVISVTNNFD